MALNGDGEALEWHPIPLETKDLSATVPKRTRKDTAEVPWNQHVEGSATQSPAGPGWVGEGLGSTRLVTAPVGRVTNPSGCRPGNVLLTLCVHVV